MANLIDRLVSAVSPGAGLHRVAQRAALIAATAMSSPVQPGGRIAGGGGYRGGQSDRRATKGWFARVRSANADGLARQETLIARSTDAWMNLPLATAAIERRVTYAVGTGMMAIPQLDAARLGLEAEEAATLTAQIMRDYDAYMASRDPDAERSATGYELQEIVLRGQLIAGDVLGLRVMPEAQPGRRHLTAWKLVEGSRVVSPVGHTEGEPIRSTVVGTVGNVLVAGVEQDQYGAAVAYHALKKAPDGATWSRQAGDTVRIRAWGEKTGMPSAILVMQKKRAEQARGVPLLAPVLETLKQISDLSDAELFAAVLTAMLAITYKSPGAGALPEADYGTEDAASGAANPDLTATTASQYRMEAGTVLEIDSDAEVDVSAPGRPNPAFDPFFIALCKQLGAALETPAEVLLLQFEASYTASKAALENFYVLIRKVRESLGSHWCTPGYECWLYEQVAKGRYAMPGFFDDPVRRELWSDVRHRGDGKISLNPQQEAKAFEIYEAHGWRTGAAIAAELAGEDYDANVRTRIGEHRRWVEGGLPVPGAKGGGSEPASAHSPASPGGTGDDDDGE
jgi:lambda family phage portal protein